MILSGDDGCIAWIGDRQSFLRMIGPRKESRDLYRIIIHEPHSAKRHPDSVAPSEWVHCQQQGLRTRAIFSFFAGMPLFAGCGKPSFTRQRLRKGGLSAEMVEYPDLKNELITNNPKKKYLGKISFAENTYHQSQIRSLFSRFAYSIMARLIGISL